MENKYSYFMTYQYAKEVFTFELFAKGNENVFGDAMFNYDKKLEDFTKEDYEKIKTMLAESLTEQTNNMKRQAYKELDREYDEKYDEKITKSNIVIINIIPKKYEVINNENKDKSQN